MPNKSPTSTNAVIYVRFSPRKNAADCKSCEVQIDTCRAYCVFKGWDVVGIYRDDNISGKSMKNRPGIHEAMSKAIAESANMVIYDLSRLARNLGDQIKIVENLTEHNLGLSSCKEDINTQSPNGRMLLSIMGAVAQNLREGLAERTSDALCHMRDQGIRVSALPPWGSQIDPNDSKRVVKNHTELAMMRRIMAWRESGVGLRAICKLLDEAGIKPRKVWSKAEGKFLSSKWGHGRIKQILDRCKSINL